MRLWGLMMVMGLEVPGLLRSQTPRWFYEKSMALLNGS